jgi:hypothetical protein
VAAIPEKESNRSQHRRVELNTAITSGKMRTDLQNPQNDPRARIREANVMSSRLQAIMDQTLWRGQPPPKQKMKLHVQWEPVMYKHWNPLPERDRKVLMNRD